MADKEQVFLKDVHETGFYCAVDDTERLYIYEVINNVSQEWIKKDPKAKLIFDQWIYDYTDYNDRKVYGTSGNLEATYCDISTCKVYKIEDTNFKIFGNCRQFLVEDKPTYKEQLVHKAKEYNELLEQHKELDDRANRMIEEKYNLARECEELKDKLRELELKNTTLQNRNQQLDGSITEADRYREALEEIEEMCINDVYKFADGTELRYDTLDDILNIINKVKERL